MQTIPKDILGLLAGLLPGRRPIVSGVHADWARLAILIEPVPLDSAIKSGTFREGAIRQWYLPVWARDPDAYLLCAALLGEYALASELIAHVAWGQLVGAVHQMREGVSLQSALRKLGIDIPGLQATARAEYRKGRAPAWRIVEQAM